MVLSSVEVEATCDVLSSNRALQVREGGGEGEGGREGKGERGR